MKRPPPLPTPRPPRTRRPAVRTLLLCLLLLVAGAAVNVAVAWGFALRSGQITAVLDLTPEAERELWKRYAPPDFPQSYSHKNDTVYPVEIDRFGMTLRHVLVELFIDWDKPSPVYDVALTEFGLPMRSMFGVMLRTELGGNKQRRFLSYIDSPIRSKSDQLDAGKLPIGIHAAGFAFNTIFYAAVCWLLFAAPFAVRRRRRIKRGLCPACAYPVGTSDLCTECGKPVLPSPGGAV